VKATYGYAKQGAGHGYSGLKGLNALIATVSTPVAAPVIVATRLRRGASNSARGAARLVADALACARAAGAGSGPAPGGIVIVRADSAFYSADVINAAHRGGAQFSITARHDPAVLRAIASIEETAWVPIKYPNAIWDQAEQRYISDAEVAEAEYTAFTSRPLAQQVTARLIVRRVRRLNTTGCYGQGELLPTYRHHAVFTDSPLVLLQAEAAHRGHAIIEQVHADLRARALAHLPSGTFTANAAWLVLAAMAFNLTRAAGTLASPFHAKATTATIRRQLITVPARLARSARRLVIHLPRHWPWQHAWQHLADAVAQPPPTAT
jgi:hypothetical protein